MLARMQERGFQRWLQYLVNLTGLASLGLGAVVLLGWYTHDPALIQVNPAFVPMQYNTALGFALGGGALLGLAWSYPRTAAVFGLLVALVGVLTLIEYLFGLDLHIDQLFMEHYIEVKTSHPGRMAPDAALSFVLTGAALLTLGTVRCPPVVLGTLGSMILALGLAAFFGLLSGVDTTHGWGHGTGMAVHTAIGFAFLGTAITALGWLQGRRRSGHAGGVPLASPARAGTIADRPGAQVAGAGDQG